MLWLSLATLALLLLLAGFVATPSQRAAQEGALSISGDLHVPLRPGTSQPINLMLTNRHPFALRITHLKVRLRIDSRHARAGCSARRDFRAVQLRRRAYPIRLPAGRRHSLTGLQFRRANLPRVRMVNHLAVNQDACKGAKLRLDYSGRARR